MNHFTLLDMTHSEIVDRLSTFDLADQLTTIQLDSLASFLKPFSASANTTLLTEGEKNTFFFLIAEGQVEVVKKDNANSNKKLNTFNAGKVVGEISFFDEGPCSASVIAKNNVTLLVMDKDSFNALCTHATHVALTIMIRLMKNISQRLRHTTGQLVDLL